MIRKTEPHQKWSSNQPPVTGPMATAMPEVPAQMAMARARSRWSVNTLVRIESVAGMISAPPMPMTARQKISWAGSLDQAEMNDAEPMIARPSESAGLRP